MSSFAWVWHPKCLGSLSSLQLVSSLSVSFSLSLSLLPPSFPAFSLYLFSSFSASLVFPPKVPLPSMPIMAVEQVAPCRWRRINPCLRLHFIRKSVYCGQLIDKSPGPLSESAEFCQVRLLSARLTLMSEKKGSEGVGGGMGGCIAFQLKLVKPTVTGLAQHCMQIKKTWYQYYCKIKKAFFTCNCGCSLTLVVLQKKVKKTKNK